MNFFILKNLKKPSCILLVLVLGVLASCSTRNINSDKDIKSFTINNVDGTISGTNIVLTLPIGSSLTSLTPTITTSAGAIIFPTSGTAQNFTHPVTYTVLATDSTTKEYVVKVAASTRAAGAAVTFSADGISFNMAYVPGGLSFPVGIMDATEPETIVGRGYWIGDTEVTYELWDAVHTWAINPARGAKAYTFANPGV
jgi:hypothetical protein